MSKHNSTILETNVDIQKGPIKTAVPLKRGYMGFHVSFGECRGFMDIRVVHCKMGALLLILWTYDL